MTTFETLKALNEGYEHTLPSGLTCRLRRLQLTHYLRQGTLPGHIQALVTHFLDGHTLKESFQQHPGEVKGFFDWVLCATLVEPKVAVEPEDAETLPLDYLPEPDKAEIFEIAFRPIQETITALRPLSKRGKGKRSSSSTTSPAATDNAPAS